MDLGLIQKIIVVKSPETIITHFMVAVRYNNTRAAILDFGIIEDKLDNRVNGI